MARDTQYPRGAGSPPIPEDALTQLKSDLQTLNNINNKAIQSGLTSVQTGAGVAVYEDILQLVATSETVTDPDTGMSQTDWTPDPNVAANVVAWLVGAIGVNSDSTFGGAFIRDYTADQIMLRSGSDAPPTSQLNNLASLASNLIAASVGADVVLYGDVPDIVGLATYDAGNVAATAFSTALYSSGYYPGSVTTGGAGGQASFTGGDYAAWAGSLLFSYLGDSGVYEDWILNSNTFSLNGVTYKNTTGSYDLISSIIAATEAGFQAAVPFHIGGALEAYLIGPAGATANPVGLIAETNAWFSGYYFLPSNNGYTGGEFLPGPNTVFAGNITTTVDYVLGTLASDSQLDETANTSNVISVGDEIGTTLYEPAMIVGGPNDDVIHGFADGDELIDGGDGNNTIYAGGGQSIIYGGGAGNNTIYGNSQDTSLSGNLFGTIDLLVGGGGDGIAANNAIDAPDPTLQPPADGTDTFYLQDDTDIVVGGDGKNVFNIDDTNFSPYLDIIWGGGGASNYNFTISPGGRQSSVLIVHMDNPSLTKVLGLSATAIESLVQSDGLGAGTIVMIDPTSNDTISLNGKVLQGAGYSDTVSPNGYSGLLDYVDANDIAYIPGFGYPSNGNFPSTPANALTVGTVQNGAGVSFATQTYVAPLLNVANFVDGDFGITLNPVSPVQGPYGGTSPYGDVDYYSDFHQLFAVNPLFFSDTSQQTISVGSTGDTLSGDNGNNFLTGTGNVTYDIDQGDGLVTVASASDPNTGEGGIIALDSSFSPDTVSVSAGGPNGTYSDIIIQDSAGDGVDLASALSSSASPISQVEFSDGTVWSYAQLLSIIAAEHVIDSHGTSTYETGKGDGDTFIYNQGYGQLSIFVSQYLNDVNILSFGAGISASQVAVKGDASGDIVLTDGVVGDQVVLQDMLYGTGYGVESVQFADGTTWTAAQIIAQSLVGTTGADTLYGTTGADIFDGKGAAAGSQDYEQGNGGADTFVFNQGYSQLEINEYGDLTDASTLLLGQGLAGEQLQFKADRAGDLYITDGTAGDRIEFDSYFSPTFDDGYGPQTISFADGSSLSRAQILAAADIGTPGADILITTTNGQVLDGKGAPAGSEDYEQGSGGADTLIYNAGYGQLEISEQTGSATETGGGTSAVLQLGSGITLGELSASFDGAGDLILFDGTPGDSIKIDGMLDLDFYGVAYKGIVQVNFSDGTSVTREQLLAPLTTGTLGADVIHGVESGSIFDGEGAPAGSQDYEQGESGNDTFIYHQGYGQLEIYEYTAYFSASAAVLQLGQGISKSDLSITEDSQGNAVVSDGTAGDFIKIDQQFDNAAPPTLQFGVGSIRLADGSIILSADFLTFNASQNNTLVASQGNSTITVTGNSYLLEGGSVDAVLNATGNENTLAGGSGSDMLTATGNNNLFTSASGNEQVNVTGNSNTVQAGASSISITLSGNNNQFVGGSGIADVVVGSGSGNTFSAGTGSVTLDYSNDPAAVTVNLGAGTASFAGAAGIDVLSGISQVTIASNSAVLGGAGPVNLLLVGNDSTLLGGSGFATMTSYGDGDTLAGGSGGGSLSANGSGNQIEGGPGTTTDVISGNDNTWQGGSGTANLTVYGNLNMLVAASGDEQVSVNGNSNIAQGGSGDDEIT